MKNLKSLLNKPLTWTFKKKKIILQSDNETIIELIEEKHSKASFEFDGKDYIILNKGFWNAKTIIEKDGVNSGECDPLIPVKVTPPPEGWMKERSDGLLFQN